MFVWRDFREDGKFRRERSFSWCSVGRRRGKKYGGCGHNAGGGVCLGRVDRDEENILESLPSFGLETIYIAPFYGRIDLTVRV